MLVVAAAIILVIYVYQRRCYCATAIEDDATIAVAMLFGCESNGAIND